jgi:hypothetical protein
MTVTLSAKRYYQSCRCFHVRAKLSRRSQRKDLRPHPSYWQPSARQDIGRQRPRHDERRLCVRWSYHVQRIHGRDATSLGLLEGAVDRGDLYHCYIYGIWSARVLTARAICF